MKWKMGQKKKISYLFLNEQFLNKHSHNKKNGNNLIYEVWKEERIESMKDLIMQLQANADAL